MLNLLDPVEPKLHSVSLKRFDQAFKQRERVNKEACIYLFVCKAIR
jgi:hypothetical protein